METFQLSKFYIRQKQLDQKILHQHNLTFDKTLKLRILALLIELGELANETRMFKFWSQNQKIKRKQLILEYIDCFHFFLSLGNYFHGRQKQIYFVRSKNLTIPNLLLKIFQETSQLINHFSLQQYQKAFQLFLNLSSGFKITNPLLKKYYLQKYKENIKRQKNKY